jgi:acid phosphatase type 7
VIFNRTSLGTAIALIFSVSQLFCETAKTNLSDPPALYLQWQRDPTTTMTVHWHTANPTETALQFRDAKEKTWRDAKGSSVPMPDTTSGRTIHTVGLTGLTPKTDYQFRFGEQSKEYKFRTMPKDLSAPIKFIEGGDVYHQRDWMDNMNALAAKFDPAFIVIGGDLAYANNRPEDKPESVQRWYDFFDSWKKNAVAPDGRLIPLLCTLGNHEVKGFWGKPPENAPCFYACFSMPGKQGYNNLDFGDYLTLLLMDSGHTHPIDGAQTEWLSKTLSQRQTVPHVFPIYHVPAYPSCRPDEEGENSDLTQQVRKFWCPQFEKYGVQVSFEHHDHAYKRTKPMLGGKIDPKGIIYLGDGAWGVRLRTSEPDGPRWYIEKSGIVRHFYLVTLYPDRRDILAINDKGEVFDEVHQPIKVERKP